MKKLKIGKTQLRKYIAFNLMDDRNENVRFEIRMFGPENVDNRRLYVAYYFKYKENEYKFAICVNREEPKGTIIC